MTGHQLPLEPVDLDAWYRDQLELNEEAEQDALLRLAQLRRSQVYLRTGFGWWVNSDGRVVTTLNTNDWRYLQGVTAYA